MDVLVHSPLAQQHTFSLSFGVHAKARIIFVGSGCVVKHEGLVGSHFVLKRLVLGNGIGIATITTASKQERKESHEDERSENNAENPSCGHAVVFFRGACIFYANNAVITTPVLVTTGAVGTIATRVTTTSGAAVASTVTSRAAITISTTASRTAITSNRHHRDRVARVPSMGDAFQSCNFFTVFNKLVVELVLQFAFFDVTRVVNVGIDVRVRAVITVGFCECVTKTKKRIGTKESIVSHNNLGRPHKTIPRSLTYPIPCLPPP